MRGFRSFLYLLARLMGDVNAVKNGKVSRRVGRRAAGKAAGKGMGKLNDEMKRRTKVVRIFPNEEALLRLVTALCVETSEEWITGRRYLDMELLDEMEDEDAGETTKEVTHLVSTV